MKEKKKKRNSFMTITILTAVLLVLTTITGIVMFRVYISNLGDKKSGSDYKLYYAMIVEERESAFWKSVYEGAYEAGLEQGVYIDLFGTNAFRNKSKEELLQIAVDSGVDGIILEADESEEMTDLIDRAVAEGIPVVTVYGDNANSERCSYVGVGNYDIGQEYGKQVLTIAGNLHRAISVAVLTSENAKSSGQNTLFSGIQDVINQERKKGAQIELSMVSVDDSNAFSAEEAIRDIFTVTNLPDIIICLNERNTTCVYQTIVDYNKVGQVQILGYYDSESIIKAIEREVIHATIAVDTKQMGRFCVEALQEHYYRGYTSQYFSVDIKLINQNNVAEYREKQTLQ